MSRRHGIGYRIGNLCCKLIWWGCWAGFIAHIIAGR